MLKIEKLLENHGIDRLNKLAKQCNMGVLALIPPIDIEDEDCLNIMFCLDKEHPPTLLDIGKFQIDFHKEFELGYEMRLHDAESLTKAINNKVRNSESILSSINSAIPIECLHTKSSLEEQFKANKKVSLDSSALTGPPDSRNKANR